MAEAIAGTTYKHSKTGGLYRILHLGRTTATPPVPVVVYTDLKGNVWVRELSEFEGLNSEGVDRFVHQE